ncbi:MAG: cell division protein ZapE [Rhodobacter sp.]|nr:cell division protein ZapE [Rhodobacter sp.]
MGELLHAIYDRLAADGEITADPAQREVFPALERIQEYLALPARRKGLFGGVFASALRPPSGVYIWGGVGRGKSFLMDLFFDAVEIEDKRRVHFHAFMQDMHAGMHAFRKRGVEDALRPVAEAVAEGTRLLCLDEMQIVDITDAMIVGRLFEALIGDGVAIVTTSNRRPDDLYRDGLNRGLFLPFLELIKERMVVHHLESPTDYRRHRLQGADSYFSPADAEARTAMDAIWIDLTGGIWEPLALNVVGRRTVLPRFRNGVARAPFWELCGQPLGPADYLAVADAVRVLLVDDVPLLSRSNFNEARRFVILVDALYEARVKLVVSAADVPERLYIEGGGTFEFERTVSRLWEMRSEDWGMA